MDQNSIRGQGNAVGMLRRLARRRTAAELCDFCSCELESSHRHLVEVASSKLVCACTPCALTFENARGARWKLVPRRARVLNDFQLTDGQWESLGLPINLAFFVFSTPAARTIARYPSPAGPTESQLPLAAWNGLLAENPCLCGLRADVEALLVNRVGKAREYYLAPIDACYELVGLIRKHWRGFSGGDAVWREIAAFFSRLKAEAEPLGRATEVANA